MFPWSYIGRKSLHLDMGLIVMALLCCVFLSILWIPSASSHALDQSSSLKATEAVRSTRFVLARKFKLMEEARVNDKVGVQLFQDPKQKNEHKENVSGQLYEREQSGMGLGRKGRKWVNAADMSSRFFTMDYAHVKRRRPVHNMSLEHP